MTEPGQNYVRLPRGGYLVDTEIGSIQFGAPPETIKDTMMMPGSVPEVFVLSGEMFNWIKGISIAEIEFPLYYNFFIRKKKTVVVCTREQYRRIIRVLQESLFGPLEFDISVDFENSHKHHAPDIRSEMSYFRNNLKFSDVLSFRIFKDNRYCYKGIEIEIDKKGDFHVSGKSGPIAVVPGKSEYKATYLIGERLPEPYRPPLFGVTCLGPSHGFDPEENTSGFIIWLNHCGIMVDPPVNSTEWLEDSNVNPKLIDNIILTHCHADHDAGTFQKILEEGKVTIYTTETIMMSFLRKYASLTNVSMSYLMKLFTFHPVKIGKPVFINGGRFEMFYTLHSIPTMGFRMEFQDQSFVYTSDHNNDPEIHEDLFKKGVIGKERYDELRDFPWDSKVIYHESGVPPLHTPIRYLDSLPEEIKKKTVVYHIAKKDFPALTTLKLARFGIENTLYFDAQAPRFETAYQILTLLKNLDFLHDVPVDKAREFLDIVEEEHYQKGTVIIHKGDHGDKFYIIYSGNISVDSGNLQQKKIYGSFDYFGELALITEQNRAADVVAETDIVVYTISREKFLNFIVGTGFEKRLRRLAKIRNSETWNLLSASKFFSHCTSSQKTWLESLFIPVERNRPGYILKENSSIDCIYIVRSGRVKVKKGRREVAFIGRGAFIGTMQRVHRGELSNYGFYHDEPVSLFAIKKDDIMDFVENNPGLLMKLDYDFD